MENLIKLNAKKYLGRKQIVLDCKFQIESGKEVQKVLAVGGNPVLSEINISSGSINFAGKVNLKLLYIAENGERESLNCIADFNELYENSEIVIGDYASIDLKVVDVTTPSVKANEVKVACILDAVITLCKNVESEQVSEQENVFYKTSEKQIARQVASIKDDFDLTEEFKIDGDLKSVLNLDVKLIVKECFCGSGFVVASGDALVNIVYEDDASEIKNYKTTFPFKQEIASEIANNSCIVSASAKVLDYLAKCSIVQGDNYNIIKWEAPVTIFADVFENSITSIYDDAYSSLNLLDVKYSTNEVVKGVALGSFEDNVKGELPLKDGENATLCANMFDGVEVSSAYIEDDKLCIEGVVSSTIIYKDENLAEHSVIAEFPYISKISKNEFVKSSEINVNANIIDIDIGFKNGNIELIAKLMFNVAGFEKDNISIISSIEIEGERQLKDCAMEILISSSEQTLWDLGKMLGVSVEQLQKQNPNLHDVVHKNDKVVLYYNLCAIKF